MRKQKNESLSDIFLDKYPTHSLFSESYRSLRTNVNFSFIDKDFRSLLITSAGAKEGKSVTTANLGFTMAQAGKKTLLIDADLRKPTLSSILESTHPLGLSVLLSSAFSLDVRSGSLEEFGVSDLFRLISFQKMTGALNLEEEKERVNIYFLDGNPVDVQWLTRPKEKRLASLLIKNKLLTKEQAEEALSRISNTGQKLGFMLIMMGLAKEEDLAGLISLHMIEGLRTSLQFKTGLFSFETLPQSYFEESAFNPADLPNLYRQVILGQEQLFFIQKQINASIVKTHIENLFLLPAGPDHPKPAELLNSNRMSFLLSHLRRQFDILVVDSPPILVASDALVIAPQTDGVLLIVKTGELKRDLIKKSVDQIRRTQANLIGVALNQVEVKHEGYYNYYKSYYGKKKQDT